MNSVTPVQIFIMKLSQVGCDYRIHRMLNSLHYIKKVKLAIIVDGDPKAPFSIATSPKYLGGLYSFHWIATLYPWSLPSTCVLDKTSKSIWWWEVPVMVPWWMCRTLLLSLLPGPLWPGVVVLVRVPPKGQKELFNLLLGNINIR